MNTLFIEPNIAKKTMRLSGVIAAGEHVAVIVRNTASLRADTTRLRVICGETIVAQFPMNGEVWSADSNDLSCVLNLNTVQAEKASHCAPATCLFVLDDVSEEVRQLYGTSTHRLEPWVKSPDTDIPTDLDSFPSVIDEFRADIAAWKLEVGDSLSAYQQTLSSAWNSYREALDAAQRQFVETVRSQVSTKVEKSDFEEHLNDHDNPHQVSARQIGAATTQELSEVRILANQSGTLAESVRVSVLNEISRSVAKDNELASLIAREEARAKNQEDSLREEISVNQAEVNGLVEDESCRAREAEEVLRSSIAAIKTFKVVLANELPSVGEPKTFYLVPSQKSAAQNVRDEYLWINGAWEQIGSTAVDLSDYVKKTDVIPEEIADGVKIATIGGKEIKAPKCGGGGGGNVLSVNGKTGEVVLKSEDIEFTYSGVGQSVDSALASAGQAAFYAEQLADFARKTILDVQFVQNKADLEVMIGQVEGFCYVFSEKKLWRWQFMSGYGVEWLYVVPESEYPAVMRLFTHNNSILDASILSNIKPIEDGLDQVLA